MEPIRKRSKKRDAILACIRSTTCHPTAEWVYQQLKPQYPDLSLGTVYRNLALFKEEGTILSLGTVREHERYDGDTSPHTHFICSQCGSVQDLPDMPLPQDHLQELETSLGASITSYQLQFYGICADCDHKK